MAVTIITTAPTPYASQQLNNILRQSYTNVDPLKDWVDTIGMVNSPNAGTGVQPPIQ
jgi:hypothetical protein